MLGCAYMGGGGGGMCLYICIHMCVSPTGWVKVATHQAFQGAHLQVSTCSHSSCLSLGTLSHVPFV